jgi:hypothetical protein
MRRAERHPRHARRKFLTGRGRRLNSTPRRAPARRATPPVPEKYRGVIHRVEKKSAAVPTTQGPPGTIPLPLELALGYVLGADDCQWILYRERKRREEAYLQPLSFIGSTKSTLLRVLREKGVNLTAEAVSQLETMPEQFGQ